MQKTKIKSHQRYREQVQTRPTRDGIIDILYKTNCAACQGNGTAVAAARMLLFVTNHCPGRPTHTTHYVPMSSSGQDRWKQDRKHFCPWVCKSALPLASGFFPLRSAFYYSVLIAQSSQSSDVECNFCAKCLPHSTVDCTLRPQAMMDAFPDCADSKRVCECVGGGVGPSPLFSFIFSPHPSVPLARVLDVLANAFNSGRFDLGRAKRGPSR